MDHAYIDMLRLTDEPEVQHSLDVAVGILLGASQFARADHGAVFAGDADCKRPGARDQAGNLFVDGAGQHHLYHFHHRRIGHA